MSKNGMTGTEAFGWLLAIFIFFIILVIMLGPEKLLAKARDAAFSFGLGQVPEEQSPQFSTKAAIPEELGNYFDNLVSKIKNPGKKNSCWISIGEQPSTKSYSIGLYQNKIDIEKSDEHGISPTDRTETIDGFVPCYVSGSQALTFYDCFSSGGKCTTQFEISGFLINKNIKIAPILFKFDDSHVCVIYVDGFDWSPFCDRLDNVIDNTCIGKIQENYQSCSS